MDMLDKAVLDLEQAADACEVNCDLLEEQDERVFSDPGVLKAVINQIFQRQLVISRHLSLLGTILQAVRSDLEIPDVQRPPE